MAKIVDLNYIGAPVACRPCNRTFDEPLVQRAKGGIVLAHCPHCGKLIKQLSPHAVERVVRHITEPPPGRPCTRNAPSPQPRAGQGEKQGPCDRCGTSGRRYRLGDGSICGRCQTWVEMVLAYHGRKRGEAEPVEGHTSACECGTTGRCYELVGQVVCDACRTWVEAVVTDHIRTECRRETSRCPNKSDEAPVAVGPPPIGRP